MMDYRFVEQNRDRLERSLKLRKSDFCLSEVEALGQKRRAFQVDLDEKRAKLNALSVEIGAIFQNKSSDQSQAQPLKKQSGELKNQIQKAQDEFAQIEQELSQKLLFLPNALHESVVPGDGAQDNPVIRTWGEPKSPVSNPKSHDELGVDLGIIDFERAAKIAGARFAVLFGWGARLERALISFMMDLHRQRGYRETWPTFLINRASMTATGQLPKFEQDAFRIVEPELYLAPTAEVPVTNYHRDEIIDMGDLPIRYVAFSPCFRREAGSYGKDTKGLIRQHQFDKVELVKVVAPDASYEELESLTCDAEEVLKRLELPYRVVSLCGADMGFSSAKTYDLEVWLPGQQAYREISSCSNFEDFQARRANIRFRPPSGGKLAFAHTLNGSGLAVGRTLIAVLENHQQADGTIRIPKCLRSYLDGCECISKEL